MRAPTFLFLCLAVVSGCSKAPDQRSFTLQGQVQSIDAARKLAVVKHEEIKGFMPAMTMPYEVREPKVLDGLAAGDLINATLVVESNGAFLTNIKKVGSAPLEKPVADASNPPTASSGFELLKPGDQVPNGTFRDQDDKVRHFSDFKGTPVAMTFIYTECPLPTFCPLIDRHFAAIQTKLKEDPALKAVHLVTVSFDPVTDTPAVLLNHARRLEADLTRWTFLTGDRDDIDKFASRFGVQVSRALDNPRDITHNLRTVIIGADGALLKTYTGNDWTVDQVVADLKSIGS
ncbi:MAG TPA: SCO family protein [Vicinamibacterales bacterium]|jgi:protein SCO1/2